MLNCEWEEVHDFIQRKRDDTEDRFSFDKISTRTMDSDVEESQSNDFKHIITNVLPEVSRKPKMKVKATKVFKYLLNFLQTKPRKFEDKEKLCIPSTPQDSFAYENPESYEFSRLEQMPNSQAHKPDGILSMSWSYLVHDPFKEMPDLEEETNEKANEVFYNDSYFEDDYCQDFREKEWTPFRTPAGDNQNVSYNRLFEPERTPCGEYRRSVVTQLTPCRRQASLPNFLVDNHVLSLAETFEAGPSEDSELVDVDDFMTSHPLVGLNIAFDNVLEETNSESVLYSLTPAQFMATEEIYQFENNPEQTFNETYTNRFDFQPSGSSGNETSSDRTPYNSCIARDSFHKLHDSCQLVQKSDEVLVYNVQSGLQKDTLDTFLPSSCVNKYPKHDQIYQESTGPSKTSKQFASVESGYSSCDSSPSSGSSPETLSHASVSDIKSSNSYILPTNTTEISVSSNRHVFIDKQKNFSNTIFPQTPYTGYTKAAQRREIIQTNLFQTSTSSPMQVINTPTFMNACPLPTMTISPIKQNVETPKTRLPALDSDSSFKRSRRHRRNETAAKVYNIQPRLLDESNDKTNTGVTDPFCDNHLKAAANVILNRIQFKDLQRHIKMEDLITYLKSYYMKEIVALSNRNVKSISDYKKISIEACDTFTTRRLTSANSYCELMTAILANRPEIISVCEEFIFKNHDYFIRSQDFFEAAPEIILLLLCNNSSSIFGVARLPLRVGDSGLELNAYLDKYIERQRTDNSQIYFRVKNLFACIRKKRTDLTKANPVAQKTYPEVAAHQKFECGTSKSQAHKGNNSISDRSIHLKTPNFQREPLQASCKGIRMFRNKQILFKTQGNVPEATQKLLDYVGDRKTSHQHRSPHQSKTPLASIENPSELGRRHFLSVGKYNLLANSALPSEKLNQTGTKSARSVNAAESSIYYPKKWKPGHSSKKYVTAV